MFTKIKERISSKYDASEFDTTKTLYCLRHMFITMYLAQDVNVYKLARHCGTSLKEIQRTYDDMQTTFASQELLSIQRKMKSFKDFKISELI